MEKRLLVVMVSVLVLSLIGASFFISVDGDGIPVADEVLSSSQPFNTDTDNDGLSDSEERRYDTSPVDSDTDSDGLPDRLEVRIYKTDPTSSDTDNDGLDDQDEIDIGTSPTNPDTDGDGLDDGRESQVLSTDPTETDTDSDGLSDYNEVNQYPTDPTNSDTDNDGLDDGSEIEGRTNATDPDTDDDGIKDGEEFDIATDPTDPDTDNDGLNDSLEVEIGSDPLMTDTDDDGLNDSVEYRTYNTDPSSQDTDDDGISDRREIQILNSDPTDPDTDGDGLNDSRELELETGINNSDTDGDGLPDGYEVKSQYSDQLSPNRIDVLVELDYADSRKPPDSLDKIVESFESASVQNRDGSEGINLVLIEDEPIDVSEPIGIEQYINGSYEDDFQGKGLGFYHILLVERIDGREELTGLTRTDISGSIVEYRSNNETTAATIMHEIGHSLGLDPEDFDGIDSTEYPLSEYNSVMSYSCDRANITPSGCTNIGYSSSEPFNDWEHIVQSLPDEAPPTDKI